MGGRISAEKLMCANVLLRALVEGPKSDELFALVDKHVSQCMEDQATYYKHVFLVSIGSETWVDFREGVCEGMRKRFPALLMKTDAYAQRSMQLEETLRTRLEVLPASEFERLLHTCFEQDEIKLILVGALLGAIVGFLQAVVQTPDQVGLA